MVFWVLLQGSLRNGNLREVLQPIKFRQCHKRLPDLRAAKKISKTKFTSTTVIARELICLSGC